MFQNFLPVSSAADAGCVCVCVIIIAAAGGCREVGKHLPLFMALDFFFLAVFLPAAQTHIIQQQIGKSIPTFRRIMAKAIS